MPSTRGRSARPSTADDFRVTARHNRAAAAGSTSFRGGHFSGNRLCGDVAEPVVTCAPFSEPHCGRGARPRDRVNILLSPDGGNRSPSPRGRHQTRSQVVTLPSTRDAGPQSNRARRPHLLDLRSELHDGRAAVGRCCGVTDAVEPDGDAVSSSQIGLPGPTLLQLDGFLICADGAGRHLVQSTAPREQSELPEHGLILKNHVLLQRSRTTAPPSLFERTRRARSNGTDGRGAAHASAPEPRRAAKNLVLRGPS